MIVEPLELWVEPLKVTDQLAPLETPTSTKTTAYSPEGRGIDPRKVTVTVTAWPATVTEPLTAVNPLELAVQA